MSAQGITLSKIVDELLIEEERDTKHNKFFYLQHGANAIEDLHFDVDGHPQYRTIEVDTSTNTAPLPKDFLREIGVAIVDSNGNLMNLSRSPHKIFKQLDDCGDTSSTLNQAGGGYSDYSVSYGNTAFQHFRNGENIGNFFGVGGKQIAGDYNINKEQGRIELSSRTNQSTIVLKYLAMPERIGGEFMVHPYLKDAIKNYIDWASKRRKHKQYGAGFISELHRRYVVSKNWARMRLSSFDLEEAKEIAKINFTQAPKY